MGLIGGAIGSLIGGGLGALFGSGNEDIPKANYNRPTMDANAQRDLDQLKNSADENVGSIAKGTMAGVEDQGNKFIASMNSSDSPLLSQALKNRAQKSYASDLAKVSRQANIDAMSRHVGRMDAYYSVNARKQQIDQNINAYEKAAAAQAEAYEVELDAARNSAISAVLGQSGRWLGMGMASRDSKKRESAEGLVGPQREMI